MSTKRWEPCPECGANTLPTDERMKLPDLGWLKLWRYECTRCTKVWANELQRSHNDKLVDKAFSMRSGGGWYS